jgi:O-antigen/teichoic acid export membrane protein
VIRRIEHLKRVGIYFSASAINQALPFFLLPVMTRYLSPTEYGTVAIYQTLISFAIPFVGMSIHLNITRSYFQVERAEMARIVGNIVAVLVGSVTLVLLATSVYVLFRPTLFGIPARWLYTLPLVAFTNMVNQSNLVILRNQGRAATYGAFEIVKTAVNLVVSILLVVVIPLGWEGRATGVLTASIVFGVVGLAHMVRTGYFEWDISRRRITELLAVSVPLIPHGIGTVTMALVDRLFLNQMAGKEAVGVYTVGYLFGSLTLLVTDAFTKVWSPWMYEQLADMTDAKRRRIVRFTYLYKGGVVLLALAVTAGSYVALPIMVAKPFQVATPVVFWVALGYAVRGMYSMFFPYIMHMGKTRYFALVTLGAGLVNAGANYLLIPINGIVGSAQATLISWLVMYLAVWWYAARLYPMPWLSRR